MENRLEEMLRLAVADPGHRPEFYRVFLESQVFVIASHLGSAGATGPVRLEAGERLSIVSWRQTDGATFIPIFTSLERLKEAVDHPAGYVAMNARDLMEATRGSRLVLNPRSDVGKGFPPDEVEMLLAGEIPGGMAEERVIHKHTRVLLGQPSSPPAALLAALRTLFARRPGVRSASVGIMALDGSADDAELIVGIDAGPDFGPVLREAGPVAADALEPGVPVNFVDLASDEDAVVRFLRRDVEPFYTRDLGGMLPSAISSKDN